MDATNNIIDKAVIGATCVLAASVIRSAAWWSVETRKIRAAQKDTALQNQSSAPSSAPYTASQKPRRGLRFWLEAGELALAPLGMLTGIVILFSLTKVEGPLSTRSAAFIVLSALLIARGWWRL